MKISKNAKSAGLVVGGSVIGSIITLAIMMKANAETYQMIEENKELCDQVKQMIAKHELDMKQAEDELSKRVEDTKENLNCLKESQIVLNEAFKNVSNQCKELNAEVKAAYKIKADETAKYMTEVIQKESIDILTSVRKQLKELEKQISELELKNGNSKGQKKTVSKKQTQG